MSWLFNLSPVDRARFKYVALGLIAFGLIAVAQTMDYNEQFAQALQPKDPTQYECRDGKMGVVLSDGWHAFKKQYKGECGAKTGEGK